MKITDKTPQDDGVIMRLKDVKRGEFIRLSLNENARVFTRAWYDRSTKKFWLNAYDDIGDGREVKGDRLVWTGFIF